MAGVADVRFPNNPDIINDIYTFSPPFSWFIQWDSFLYIKIADQGYLSHDILTVFFPLLPLLIRGLTYFINNLAIAGLFVSQTALLWTGYLIVRLVKLDFSQKIAYRCWIFLLIFPASIFLSSIYTESLFLMNAVAAIYFMRIGKVGYAGFFGGLLACTRQPGIFILLPLLIEYFHSKKWKISNVKKDIFWLTLVPAGLVCYLFYLYVQFGNPFYFISIEHDVFNRQISWNILSTFWNHISFQNSISTIIWPARELIIALIFLVSAIWTAWKIRLSYGIYALLMLFPPLLSGTLDSMNRYVLIVFPVFILFAVWGERE